MMGTRRLFSFDEETAFFYRTKFVELLIENRGAATNGVRM
jgi:hypothetical protein